MRLEVETGLTIIVFPKLAEAAGNARGVPNGGVRSRSAISGKMCISPRCMIRACPAPIHIELYVFRTPETHR